MKAILHTGYLIIALILSPTLFAALEIFGVKPNLFLIYLVFAGFYVEQKEAIWLGLIYGLFYDIIVGANMGLNGVLYMFVCFLTVLFCENMIRRSNALLAFICVAVWTVLTEGINLIFSPAKGLIHSIVVIGTAAAYNGLIMLLGYIPMNNAFKKLYDEKG